MSPKLIYLHLFTKLFHIHFPFSLQLSVLPFSMILFSTFVIAHEYIKSWGRADVNHFVIIHEQNQACLVSSEHMAKWLGHWTLNQKIWVLIHSTGHDCVKASGNFAFYNVVVHQAVMSTLCTDSRLGQQCRLHFCPPCRQKGRVWRAYMCNHGYLESKHIPSLLSWSIYTVCFSNYTLCFCLLIQAEKLTASSNNFM